MFSKEVYVNRRQVLIDKMRQAGVIMCTWNTKRYEFFGTVPDNEGLDLDPK